MQRTTKIWSGSALLLCAATVTAQADHKAIQGRTGLPAVWAGGDKVFMENGDVKLDVSGNNLVVTQSFNLHYPGPPMENGPKTIKVAVREDYFRDTHEGGDVTVGEAKGFSSFGVTVDGRRVSASAEPWHINEKKDTATRWRVWQVSFRPGQAKRLRIVSRAPLGQDAGRKYVQFVSKDLARWRGAPDDLQIRFRAPGKTEARLAGVEPKPTDVNEKAMRWAYSKSRPHRDIYLLLPANYRQMAKND